MKLLKQDFWKILILSQVRNIYWYLSFSLKLCLIILLGEVIDLIAIYEDVLNDDLTIDNINALLSLYSKAIEYFSAQDSARYEDFLNRNKNLIQREDVQMVLNSMQDEENKKEDNDSHPHIKRYVLKTIFLQIYL